MGDGAGILRRLTPGEHRASVRELAAVLVQHIRDGGPAPSPADRWAVARFLDALADVSTPGASFELRMLAREIGGRS